MKITLCIWIHFSSIYNKLLRRFSGKTYAMHCKTKALHSLLLSVLCATNPPYEENPASQVRLVCTVENCVQPLPDCVNDHYSTLFTAPDASSARLLISKLVRQDRASVWQILCHFRDRTRDNAGTVYSAVIRKSKINRALFRPALSLLGNRNNPVFGCPLQKLKDKPGINELPCNNILWHGQLQGRICCFPLTAWAIWVEYGWLATAILQNLASLFQ